MPVNIIPARACVRAWLIACVVLTVMAFAPSKAHANCWSTSNSNMSFGTVSVNTTSTSSANFGYTCQSEDQTTYFTLCAAAAAGTPDQGTISPRWMSNNNQNGITNYLAFNLYSDPARTRILGPDGDTTYATYTWQMALPGGFQQSTSQFTIYGSAPPYKPGIEAGTYFNYLNGVTLRYSESTTGYPPSCEASNSTLITYFMQTDATVPQACNIISATDLDFGQLQLLTTAADSTSTIQVQCPASQSFQVGLNNGLHADGTTRRMQSPGGGYVQYELYRDSARSLRWGQTLDTDTMSGIGTGVASTLTVYGRIPLQATPAAGTYTDTIIITLTY